MAVEIPMPRLSQTTDEVKLIRWLVKPGDAVAKGQALAEVENDKTTMEVESFAAGTVLRLSGEPDSMIAAGSVIAVLGEPGERPEAGAAGTAPAPPGRTPASPPAPAPTGAPGLASAAAAEGVLATPLVRNLARKHGVDLGRVRGTGARGLITRADLDSYLRAPSTPPSSAPATAPSASQSAAPSAAPAQAVRQAAGAPQEPGLPAEVVEVPLSAHQRAVARAVTAAKSQVPHYYLRTRIGADRLQAWRETHRRADGRKVAVDAILAWACARALARHPRLNGTLSGERLRLEPQVHIGVAVAAGEELHVPVVRQAQLKDIAELDRELAGLVDKARAGRLAAADLSGGTFTLTNLGMYPVEDFAAVLNAPQVAIAAAGRIGREIAVAEDGSFRARSALSLTGSFDHRAVNGAQGAAFLAEIKRILEEEL